MPESVKWGKETNGVTVERTSNKKHQGRGGRTVSRASGQLGAQGEAGQRHIVGTQGHSPIRCGRVRHFVAFSNVVPKLEAPIAAEGLRHGCGKVVGLQAQDGYGTQPR